MVGWELTWRIKKKKKNSANQWKLAWPNIIFQSSKSLSSFRMTRFQCACTNFPFNFCINKKITSTAARTVAHAYCHITSTLHSTAPFSCKDSLVRFYSTALIPLFLSLPSSFLRTPLSLSPYWSESTSYLSLSSFSLLLLFVSLSVSECVSKSVSISISKLKVSESTSYLFRTCMLKPWSFRWFCWCFSSHFALPLTP